MNDDEKRNPIEDPAVPHTDAPAEAEATELQSCIERLQRMQAEFENYKKRIARDAADREERTSDQFLLDVLPLYDALGFAFENYNRDKDAEAFVAGTERIFAQFEQTLSTKGVSRIEALGKGFDPAYHEALLSLETEEPKNTIVEEFAPGYVRNGRTLRPSKVAVSQGPAKEEKE